MRTTFALAAIFCLSAPVLAADPSTSTRDFPVFGLTVDLPANAAVSPALPANQLFEGRHSGSADGAFALVFPTSGAGHVSMQDMLKVNPAGEVSGNFTIDGEIAKLVRMPAGGKNPPCAMIVAEHGNRTLVIEGYGADDARAQQNALAIANSVHFKDAESPALHTELSDRSRFRYKAGEGYLSVAAPAWMRVLRQDSKVVAFGGQDFTSGKMPFVVAVSQVDVQKGGLDAGVVQNWAEALQSKYQVAEGVHFRNSTDHPQIFASQPVQLAQPGDDGLTAQRFALVQVSPGSFVSLIFNVYDDNEGHSRAYLDLADKMIQAVHITPPAASASADAAGK